MSHPRLKLECCSGLEGDSYCIHAICNVWPATAISIAPCRDRDQVDLLDSDTASVSDGCYDSPAGSGLFGVYGVSAHDAQSTRMDMPTKLDSRRFCSSVSAIVRGYAKDT